MAIFGMGSKWGSADMTQRFIDEGVACIGYWPEEASSYYQIFQCIKNGDIIYLKASDWKKKILRILAIALVYNNNTFQRDDSQLRENCIRVKWVHLEKPIEIAVKDTAADRDKGDPYVNSVYGITLYEEFNPGIQRQVVDELFRRIANGKDLAV